MIRVKGPSIIAVPNRWKMGEGAQMELEEWVTVGSGYPAHMLVVPEQVTSQQNSWHKPVNRLSWQGMVYTANYGGSSFSGLALGEDGKLGDVVHLENFPGPGETCRY